MEQRSTGKDISAKNTPGETLRSRFIAVDETGSQIQVENQGTYPVEIRGEMRMGKRMREKSRYDSLIKTPKKEQEEDEQECRELHLILRVPNICPLVETSGKVEYKPWSFTDMGAILAKLPHITSGGGKWIGKVITLTQGHTLAIGDLRALLGQVLTVGQITEIEREAGTVGYMMTTHIVKWHQSGERPCKSCTQRQQALFRI